MIGGSKFSQEMLYSRLFAQSSKSEGSNLAAKSHRLLVQAGYIRESVAGRYYFLPLGQKVQLKLMEVVRREMDKAGAQEILAPILHPLELWQETNRDSSVGFELMQLKDRRDAEFALGGTAEEMMVDLVRKFNLSWRNLPFNIYQFGMKFRDELRARGGLLRTREFIMKDAYSFSTEEQFEEVYKTMRQAYLAVFEAIGLKVVVVDADNGYIGGEYCHEFIADAEVGESLYFEAENGYRAHEDIAVFDKGTPEPEAELGLEVVEAKRGPTMADSFACHAPAEPTRHIKNVAYLSEDGRVVLACLRGDLDVNEIKLKKVLGCHQLTPLTSEQITDWLGSAAGFISAVGLKLKQPDYKLVVVADDSLEGLKNAISGANEPNKDYVNINFGRDFTADFTADIALAKDGHKAVGGGQLRALKGIEVGNTFQLGYHYSDKMKGAEYIDSDGKPKRYYMGCYGIGIGRTLAAVAEINSDDKGLIWPVCLTPYHAYLVDLTTAKERTDIGVQAQAVLTAAGLDVMLDDRFDTSPGEKLTNADLLGFPIRLVVSPKTIAAGGVEVKSRRSSETEIVELNALADYCQKLLNG